MGKLAETKQTTSPKFQLTDVLVNDLADIVDDKNVIWNAKSISSKTKMTERKL